MNSLLQILVLAGIAVFLIFKLRDVLGTREGFEKPPVPLSDAPGNKFEVIEGSRDDDILDHTVAGSPNAAALAAIKTKEPSFNTAEFLRGAKSAYEMILMAFERGDISQIRPFLSEEVANTFDQAIADRLAKGISITAEFVGIREMALDEVLYDTASREAEITVRFVGEMTSVAKTADGTVVAGSATEVKRQRDLWSFARVLGSVDPNWKLVATGE